MNPYQPLEVIDAFHRVDGHRWFVRDVEESRVWLMVEYVDSRLTCCCDDGQAHAETPDTEPPCVHLRAVIDERMAMQRATGPKLGSIVPSVFVD